MKNIFSTVLCLLTSVLCFIGTAALAQTWIIDGQQTQTLNLNVSDPQALYTDGSRQMEAPVVFADSVSQTSGLFRAYNPWREDVSEFFIFDADEEWVDFATGIKALKIGDTIFSDFGIDKPGTGKRVDMYEGCLYGEWTAHGVPDDSEAIINRSYADSRYLRQEVDLTAPLAFAASYTATGGMFRAYIPWDDQNSDLFVFNGDDECIDLSADQNAALRIGGVLINQSGVSGSGVSVSFEDNTLFGPWKLNQVTDNSLALLNRSYADSRYVMNGQDAVEFGVDTVASGDYAAAFGYKNHASGKYSVAFNGAVDPEEPEEGIFTNVASGIGSAVFGWGNIASGNGAVAFGWESEASGNWSLAAGSSDAIGEFSTALGEGCNASGSDSFAAGYNTSATGSKSVAFGHSTTASAQGSFANGYVSSASGNYSTAWGSYCEASGPSSIALGTRAKALHPGAVVIADSQNVDVTSATNDTFTIRAQNGVYLQTDAVHSSGPLVFDQSVTSHLFQAYVPWAGQSEEFFKADIDNECFKFCTGNAKLRIGSDLLYDGSGIAGFGQTVSIEEGILYGDWALDSVLNADEAIITRAFADNRYLKRTEGITTNRVIQAGDTLVISNGLITAINP